MSFSRTTLYLLCFFFGVQICFSMLFGQILSWRWCWCQQKQISGLAHQRRNTKFSSGTKKISMRFPSPMSPCKKGPPKIHHIHYISSHCGDKNRRRSLAVAWGESQGRRGMDHSAAVPTYPAQLQKVFLSLGTCFWGGIFLILRRNFPNMDEDFPNIEEKFS